MVMRHASVRWAVALFATLLGVGFAANGAFAADATPAGKTAGDGIFTTDQSKRGEAVYDPFLGSGTTLIAAEMNGRVCYGTEIDPKFADVIIQRWQAFTSKQATLESDGRTFDEVKTDRLGVAA